MERRFTSKKDRSLAMDPILNESGKSNAEKAENMRLWPEAPTCYIHLIMQMPYLTIRKRDVVFGI
jgi:hypothetical protein